MYIKFEWSDRKNKLNQRKHGVDFADSWTVFEDEHAILKADPDNSDDEDRFVLLGMSVALKILVVFFCEKQEDTI
jgi:uncharacterized DUF497 family protein